MTDERTREQPFIHPDGSECREGTQRVPRRWKPCCEVFENHTWACVYDIRYEWFSRHRQWGIAVADGGTSYIILRYCPHCGTELKTRRNRGEGFNMDRRLEIPLPEE
jgi:hypothetical protein